MSLTSGVAVPVIGSVCRHTSEFKVTFPQFLRTKAAIGHKGATFWIVKL